MIAGAGLPVSRHRSETRYHYSLIPTTFGPFGIVARGDGCLVAAFLPLSERAMRSAISARFLEADEAKPPSMIVQQVQAYFQGESIRFNVPLDYSDQPPFRRMVLDACRRVPFGRTCSYSDLARAAGNAKAVRAAGSAMANNPLPLFIPCHRVLKSDGSLGGFSSLRGTEFKRRLLILENPSFDARDPRGSNGRLVGAR